MNGANLPAPGAAKWRKLVLWLINYRGKSSPEALARSFEPAQLSGMTIRRIYDLDDASLGTEAGDLKLVRLDNMLQLPPGTLRLFYRGDRAGLERMQFTREGGEEIRQFILEMLRSEDPPPTEIRLQA